MKEYGMFTINEMVEFLTYHNIDTININIYDSFKRFCNKHNLMIADIVADLRRAREDAVYEICKRVGCDWVDVVSEDVGAPTEDEDDGCCACGLEYEYFGCYNHEHLGEVCGECYTKNTCIHCDRELDADEMRDEHNGDVYCSECWENFECDECRQKLSRNQAYSHIEGTFCEDCYWEKTCIDCGKILNSSSGSNSNGDGRLVCDECWEHLKTDEDRNYKCSCCGGDYTEDTKRLHDYLGVVCDTCYWENTCLDCGAEFQYASEGVGDEHGDFYCDRCWEDYH